MKIHVCGEGLVDLVPVAPGPLHDLTPALGGGPFNVAIAAARQGADVAFQSRLSTDGFGNALVARLRDEGVDTTYVQRGEEPTTLAVTSLAGDRSASYTFYLEGTVDRLVEPVYAPADIACFGTVSLALEPGASRYAELLKQFSRRGTMVALDPNIRPFYATDEHRAFLKDLFPFVTLLKLSDDEVNFLGKDALKHVPVVVTTLGSDGLSVKTSRAEVQVPPVRTNVAETIGAGDTIMGTLLAEITRRELRAPDLQELTVAEWRDILTFAAGAASVTVSRRGANPPTRAEVQQKIAAAR